MLEKEFQYYLDNQIEFVKRYNGKFIVIVGNGVIGAYDTEGEAFLESKKKYEIGTFLIQLCSPGKDSYTQVFHTRAYFS